MNLFYIELDIQKRAFRKQNKNLGVVPIFPQGKGKKRDHGDIIQCARLFVSQKSGIKK